MSRITPQRREARRAAIVAAARQCFSRNGFHETSMSDIAAAAGMSTGAPYRYFAGKEEVILEIAGDAFRLIFQPLVGLARQGEALTAADLVDVAVRPTHEQPTGTAEERSASEDELLRCGVLAWAELLRHEDLRQHAQRGFDQVCASIADALDAGKAAGVVPDAVRPERGARVVMALLHGFVLQRVAFGLHDTAGFSDDARALLVDAGLIRR